MIFRNCALLAAACPLTWAATPVNKRQDSDQVVEADPNPEFDNYYQYDGSQQPNGRPPKWIYHDPKWFGTTTVTEIHGGQPTEQPEPVAFKPAKDEDENFNLALSPAAISALEDIFTKVPACAVARDLEARSGGACGLRAAAQRVAAHEELSNALAQLIQSVGEMFGADLEKGTVIALADEAALLAAGINMNTIATGSLALLGGWTGITVIYNIWHLFSSSNKIPEVLEVVSAAVSTQNSKSSGGDGETEEEEDKQRKCGAQLTFPDDYPVCEWDDCGSTDSQLCLEESTYPNCACIPGGEDEKELGLGFDPSIFYEILENIDPAAPTPEAGCNSEGSELLVTDFMGPNTHKSNIYDTFCNELDLTKGYSTRDEEWDDIVIHLNFKTYDTDEECSLECKDAFHKMGEKCQNDNKLSKGAALEVGCGKYWFESEVKEPEEPEEPEFEPSFECHKGFSSRCGGKPVKYCDQAVNGLTRDRSNPWTYTSGTDNNGGCSSNGIGGCGVFLEGKKEDGSACTMIGDDMWEVYQEIRDNGCGWCGSKEYEPGCIVKIDYVGGC